MKREDVLKAIAAQNRQREESLLSRYACRSSEAVRLDPRREKTPEGENVRSAFFHDADKILHSLAYTRYIDKTQVFYLFDNDHITHRVLHVQFVSKIARTIARCLRLNALIGTMSFFTSDRERRFWLWALAVMVAIYATLGTTGLLAAALRDRGLLEASFVLGLLLAGATIVTQGLKTRPGGAEIGVALGVAVAYFMVLFRMATPEERTHLFEYGVVAVFIHEALTERARNGRRVRAPAVLAWGVTAVLGWLDEGIQGILPNRVYDIRDVGFNAFAALLAIAASLVLAWAQRRRGKVHR